MWCNDLYNFVATLHSKQTSHANIQWLKIHQAWVEKRTNWDFFFMGQKLALRFINIQFTLGKWIFNRFVLFEPFYYCLCGFDQDHAFLVFDGHISCCLVSESYKKIELT